MPFWARIGSSAYLAHLRRGVAAATLTSELNPDVTSRNATRWLRFGKVCTETDERCVTETVTDALRRSARCREPSFE
jgi:hypothetical protein